MDISMCSETCRSVSTVVGYTTPGRSSQCVRHVQVISYTALRAVSPREIGTIQQHLSPQLNQSCFPQDIFLHNSEIYGCYSASSSAATCYKVRHGFSEVFEFFEICRTPRSGFFKNKAA